MNAACRWRARMVEGALRRGDWQDARQRVVDWETHPNSCCGQACVSHRGYLHGLALKLKVMGSDAIVDDLAENAHGLPRRIGGSIGS